MEALTSIAAPDILGQAFAKRLLLPENVEEWKGEFRRMVTGSPPVKMQYRWKIRDGVTMAPDYSNAVLPGADGTVAYIVSTVAGSEANAGELIEERLNEHRELSRFLHDTIAQDLVALSLGVSELQRNLGGLPCAGEAARAGELIDRCCRDVRAIGYMLSPPPQSEPDLLAAIEACAGYMREAGLEVVIEPRPGVRDVSFEAGSLLLAVLQEWAGRTIRTRAKGQLFVKVGGGDSGIVLELKNISDGNTPSLDERAAMIEGWASLRTRASALQALFEVTSGPDGAAARLVLPKSGAK